MNTQATLKDFQCLSTSARHAARDLFAGEYLNAGEALIKLERILPDAQNGLTYEDPQDVSELMCLCTRVVRCCDEDDPLYIDFTEVVKDPTGTIVSGVYVPVDKGMMDVSTVALAPFTGAAGSVDVKTLILRHDRGARLYCAFISQGGSAHVLARGGSQEFEVVLDEGSSFELDIILHTADEIRERLDRVYFPEDD